jgi:uncharacterized protein with ParB-like and HNH nuclease domain
MNGTMTIENILEQVKESKLLLPSFQRKFTWSPDEVINLFDSIYKGIPIGVIYKYIETNPKDSKFYKIKWERVHKELKQDSVEGSKEKEIEYIIDGQQRLTAMMCGFYGSYDSYCWSDFKKRMRSTSKTEELRVRQLCVEFENHNDDGDEREFAFAFKKNVDIEENNKNIEEAIKNDENPLRRLFLVSKITDANFNEELKNLSNKGYSENQIEVIERLFDCYMNYEIMIWQNNLENDDNDDLSSLDIFVALNTGGKKLEKFDLIFSVLQGSFPEVRDKFEKLKQEINDIGYEFEMTFFIKLYCYVLGIDPLLKIEQIDKIKEEFTLDSFAEIKNKISGTFKELKSWEIEKKDVPESIFLPLVYSHYKKPELFKKEEAEKFIYTAILKRVFRASTTSVLKKIREAIETNATYYYENGFSKEFSTDEIENLKEIKYGSLQCRQVLRLIQGFNENGKSPQVDHLFPKSEKPKNAVVDTSEINLEFFNKTKHNLPNLHLMTDDNQEKGDMPLFDYLLKRDYIMHVEGESYKIVNYEYFEARLIPQDIKLLYRRNYEEFYEERWTMIKTRLGEKLDELKGGE